LVENWAGHHLEATAALRAFADAAEDRDYDKAFALADKATTAIQNMKACLEEQQRSARTEPATAASSSPSEPVSSSSGPAAPTAAAPIPDSDDRDRDPDERFAYG
jgi:hypothetical protein